MDNLVKKMKAIRLVTQDGKYLTACEDRKQAKCLKRDTNTSKPDNTVWQVKWLENGKCCLWSIYDTVLAVCVKKKYLYVCQATWPLKRGWAEWDTQFMFSKLSKKEIRLKLSICIANEINLCDYGIGSNDCECYLTADDGWKSRVNYLKWTVEIVDDVTIRRNIKKLKVQQQAELEATNKNKLPQIILTVNGDNNISNVTNINSGDNINYSGRQTNGDVKLRAPAN